MRLKSVERPIRTEVDGLDLRHLRAQAAELDDAISVRLSLQHPNLCFVPLELASVVWLADMEFGHVDQVVFLKLVMLYVLHLHFILSESVSVKMSWASFPYFGFMTSYRKLV